MNGTIKAILQIAFVLMLLPAALGQPKKPLTADDLVQMKKAGFDDPTMVRAIETNGSAIDTSAQGLLALKDAGLSDAVIRAALSGRKTESEAKEPPFKSSNDPESGEVGVYFMEEGNLKPLPAEVIKQRGTSPFKLMATGGFRGVKTSGTVVGGKSSLQLAGHAIVLVIRCPQGMTADEYQVLILDAKKDHREFMMGKMGFLRGPSSGADSKDIVNAKFEKIAPNTYKATTLTELKAGEYGVYGSPAGGPPGSSGKLYTFGIQ
jgi:hypothetical protein